MVLKNLYDNSAHAIKKSNGRLKREISITVQFEQGDVLIDWEDNGCGIPKSELEKVFKSWFTTKEYGNGLGLYWAKNVVEKHNGSITVDSEEGKWTKFRLQLPLKIEEKYLS
jgi:signal transduction histidine kinase